MSETKNSEFLVTLLKRAKTIMIENHGKVLSAEYVMVAALGYCTDDPGKKWRQALADNMQQECNRMILLLNQHFPNPKSAMERLLYMLADGNGQSNRYMDGVELQKIVFAAGEKARKLRHATLPAELLIRCILEDPNKRILSFITGDFEGNPPPRPPQPDPKKTPTFDPGADSAGIAPIPAQQPQPQRKSVTISGGGKENGRKDRISEIMVRVKGIQDQLLGSIFGQDHAVNVFASGYFQAEFNALTCPEQRKPNATFLFAGPPGVGKTFLAEKAAQALQLPYKRFDMSEYCDKEATLEFAGSDKVYKNSHPGNVTDFVAQFPKCVLLFDEIEKAHLTVIHLFLQILDAGRLRDNYTDKEVSFSDAILIFTTNAGKQLYEESDTGNFSTLPRKTILRALEKDINPQTDRPFFPAAICSRFASGNVVMFNRMAAHDLRHVARQEILGHAQKIQNSLGLDFEFDEGVFTAMLLGEGSIADARTIKARARQFFDGEFFELMALLGSRNGRPGAGNLCKIRFGLNLPEDDPAIHSLFIPARKPQLLVFGSPEQLPLPDNCGDFALHYAQTQAQALQILKKEDIRAVLCDIWFGQGEDSLFLSVEDMPSLGRDFFRYLRQSGLGIPVYLLETEEHRFHTEERLALIREGARGVVRMDCQILSQLCEAIHQQQSMLDLAKANKVLHYETAQWVSPDGTEAQIRLLDFRLSIAVDHDDQNALVSAVSRPDVTFDQIIGAQDAKEELRYFVNYLKNPKQYMNTGVRPPRGVLLYGPPGTGKTMLAKAMARESDAAFIAAEGNQFLKRYVGEGSEAVHALFRRARKYAPAILFIDEIDAIARERKGDGNTGSENTLTAFLAEMDGFKNDPTKPVFVLAATNFDAEPGSAKSLDPALMRRFDRRVYIDLPGREDREEYLRRKMSANSAIHLSDEYIANIAVRATGMSLASLESVVELALRSAIRSGCAAVTDAIFDEAFETFNGGSAVDRNADGLLRTARHESGHALISWLSGDCPSYMTIVPRSDYNGYMQHGDREKQGSYSRRDLYNRIRCALGGRAAELVYNGEEAGMTTGASSDLRSATRTAMRILCTYGMEPEFGMAAVSEKQWEQGEISLEIRRIVNRILEEELTAAQNLIRQHRRCMDALVDALMQHNHLSGPEIDRICRENT